MAAATINQLSDPMIKAICHYLVPDPPVHPFSRRLCNLNTHLQNFSLASRRFRIIAKPYVFRCLGRTGYIDVHAANTFLPTLVQGSPDIPPCEFRSALPTSKTELES